MHRYTRMHKFNYMLIHATLTTAVAAGGVAALASCTDKGLSGCTSNTCYVADMWCNWGGSHKTFFVDVALIGCHNQAMGTGVSGQFYDTSYEAYESCWTLGCGGTDTHLASSMYDFIYDGSAEVPYYCNPSSP